MGEGTGGTGDAPSGAAQQARKHVFSWEQLPEGLSPTKRFKLWRDLYAGLYGSADVDVSRDGPLHASYEFVGVGDVGLNRWECTLSRYARTAAHVATDARDDVMIGFSKGGALRGQFGRKELEVPKGAIVVSTNADPTDMTYQASYSAFTGVSVSSATFAERIGNPENSFGVISGQSHAARHLLNYAELLLDDEIPMRDPVLDVRIETMLLDLIALTFGTKGDAAELARQRRLRALRLAAIKADIRENMRHPRFAIAAVAMRQGVTPRYIQILFESEGRTFTEYVHEQRLKEARLMLTSPAYASMRIGDIAFAVGFSDQTTFNRNFKSAYGATPRDVRHAALGER